MKLFMRHFQMDRIVFKAGEIVRMVVQFVSILMVRYLSRLQRPAEFCFQNNNMFENIAFAISARMVVYKNFFIAIFNNKGLLFAFPITMLVTKFRIVFLSLPSAKFLATKSTISIRDTFLALYRFCIALMGAIFSVLTGRGIKSFFTKFASYFHSDFINRFYCNVNI